MGKGVEKTIFLSLKRSQIKDVSSLAVKSCHTKEGPLRCVLHVCSVTSVLGLL